MPRKVLIQIRRGTEAELSGITLAPGELGFTTDTNKLFIGTTAGNVLLVNVSTAGDMLKSVYDTDNDGKVDAAEVADSTPWAGVTGKPSTFPPSAHKSTHASGGSDALTPGDIGAVNKAGDMITGPIGFRIGSANPRYHQNVAAYEWSTSSAAGAFVIETPITAASENVMMRLLIEGYFYDSTSPFFLIVGGYIYASGPSFYNYGYINLSKKRPLVRWGRNIATGKVVLIIGDVGDVYSYPKLWVSLLEGHSSSDNHRTGWTITQKTDLTGYDLLTTVLDVGAFWHAGNDGSNSGLDADLLDGQHASAFMPKGPVTWNQLAGV